MQRIFPIVILVLTTNLQADLPVAGVDPLKLEADFSGSKILDDLLFASANCRDDFFACGNQSEFIFQDQTGITDDGRTATLWAGRWFSEPFSIRIGQRVWAESVYVELWTGAAPYTDFAGASFVVQGVNWWKFVDQVLERAQANRKGKFEIAAPGFYGVHFSDFAVTEQTAAPASIILTATVNKVPGAISGDVELNLAIETQ
jgi:hypothetical protein